jgi:hypothetical protein
MLEATEAQQAYQSAASRMPPPPPHVMTRCTAIINSLDKDNIIPVNCHRSIAKRSKCLNNH